MTVLERELRTALELGQVCGEIALRIQAGGDETLRTRDKADDQGPVTQADLAVEAEIVETLRAAFPDDAILAEESASRADWTRHRRVWMIDPVDGTRDFAEGSASWAIHIGLAIGGHPALGVVREPGSQRTSWAIDCEGERTAWTRLDGGPASALHGVGRRDDPRWRLVTSKSHRSPRTEPLSAALGISASEQLRTGSVGVKTAMIARGEAHIYAHPSIGTKLWDSCAPQVLITAAGGRMTSIKGAALPYTGPAYTNDHGLLATGPGIDHDGIVAALRELAAEWFPE